LVVGADLRSVGKDGDMPDGSGVEFVQQVSKADLDAFLDKVQQYGAQPVRSAVEEPACEMKTYLVTPREGSAYRIQATHLTPFGGVLVLTDCTKHVVGVIADYKSVLDEGAFVKGEEA
jgi:hypothetical protein